MARSPMMIAVLAAVVAASFIGVRMKQHQGRVESLQRSASAATDREFAYHRVLDGYYLDEEALFQPLELVIANNDEPSGEQIIALVRGAHDTARLLSTDRDRILSTLSVSDAKSIQRPLSDIGAAAELLSHDTDKMPVAAFDSEFGSGDIVRDMGRDAYVAVHNVVKVNADLVPAMKRALSAVDGAAQRANQEASAASNANPVLAIFAP